MSGLTWLAHSAYGRIINVLDLEGHFSHSPQKQKDKAVILTIVNPDLTK